MISAIVNANTRKVGDAVRPTPEMRSTLMGWLHDLGLSKVVKKVVGVRTEEVEEAFPGQGVWFPFTAEKLALKKEGERSWRWFSIVASVDLVLTTDDVIARAGVRYKVMEKVDWTDQAVVEYHVVNAFDLRGGGR